MQFPLHYSRWLRPLFFVLGMGPRSSGIDVDGDEVRVRMGWAFRARIPRRNIVGIELYDGRVLSWGVHGWRGSWLVNGSSRGLVDVRIVPPVRAYVLGFPVRLRRLVAGVEERAGLLRALGAQS